MANYSLQYRPDIDGLRAIAVLFVLAFHTFPGWFKGGFIGVDIFFVISGYLISSIIFSNLEQDCFSILDFYKRRVRRIFPALITVMLSSILIGLFVLLVYEYKQLGKHLFAGAAFISNFVLWKESNYFDVAADSKPMLHLWSLGVEEQFYLFWPIILIFVWRKRWNFSYVTGLVAFISFAINIYLTIKNPTAAFYLPFPRFWELMVGGGLAYAHLHKFKLLSKFENIRSCLGLVFIFLSFFIINKHYLFPGAWALLPVVGACLIISAGPKTYINKSIFSNRALVWIGLISYPLYLWHWMILSFLRIAYVNPSIELRIVALFSIFILSVGTYYFIERPLKKYSLDKVSSSAFIVMAVIMVYGWCVWKSNLFDFQMTETEKRLMLSYDPRPDYRYKTCFLDSESQKSIEFAPQCATYGSKTAPTVLLWGDSLAAHLYPGLSLIQQAKKFTLIQRTATSCPPSVHAYYSNKGNCNEINRSIRAFIVKVQPQIVIINGRWPEKESELFTQLKELAEFLRAHGVKKIIVFGPVPDWAPDLRRLLMRKNFPNDDLPVFMTVPGYAWEKTTALNTHLKKACSALKITYIAPVDFFCNSAQLCRVKISQDIPEGLAVSDHDHMTAQASKYLFAHLNAKLLLN